MKPLEYINAALDHPLAGALLDVETTRRELERSGISKFRPVLASFDQRWSIAHALSGDSSRVRSLLLKTGKGEGDLRRWLLAFDRDMAEITRVIRKHVDARGGSEESVEPSKNGNQITVHATETFDPTTAFDAIVCAIAEILGRGAQPSTQTEPTPRKNADASPTASAPPLDPGGRSAIELSQHAEELAETEHFSPNSIADERERILREIVQRRGQAEFRRALIRAYNGRCAVTGCDGEAALEAAHIVAYIGEQSNHVTNGLLLRADIHTLFDLDLIGINPATMALSVAPAIRKSVYAELEGRGLILPANASITPSRDALATRWKSFRERSTFVDEVGHGSSRES